MSRDPFSVEEEQATLSPEEKEAAARKDMLARYGKYGELVFPAEATAPILTRPVRGALQQWMLEMSSAAELKRVGLRPRQRALLSGPPGCGKTTLAHHVAARVGLPMLVVQSSDIISKWVAQTGEQIGKLFREGRRDKGGVALFFDEFDSIAHKRKGGDTSASVEQNNIVIALLQEIDRFDGMLFAATNMAREIDPAVWRRFQMQIEIGFPGALERFAIVRMYLAPYAADDETITAIADCFDGASPALIREGCESIKRALVLGPKLKLATELPAILARFAASAAPAEGMPVPALWEDAATCADRLTSAPWPPVLS
jgi:MoxR-like ATPase